MMLKLVSALMYNLSGVTGLNITSSNDTDIELKVDGLRYRVKVECIEPVSK